MKRELSRVSSLLLAMFLALCISTSYIQGVAAEELQAHDYNRRALLASFAVERGSILVEGTPIAQSVASDDQYNWQREYPQGELYAHITGYNTLGQGNTGIESALNAELTGTASSQFLDQIEALLTGQDPQGASVALTINPRAQQAAAQALGNRSGAVVALDPTNGDILAMYSSPTYDPNPMASHNTASVLSTYDSLIAAPGKPLYNRAIAGDLYFPGSVFKLVVATAALESGRYTLNSTFENVAELNLPGTETVVLNSTRTTCGPGDPERVSLQAALVYSCNIPFAQLASELGEEQIARTAAALGYGDELSVPLRVTPSQYPTGMNQAQLMLSGFGQYDVRVTPMEVAMTTAAIANGGELMKPNMIDQLISQSLEVVSDPDPVSLGQVMSERTATAIQGAMVEGVQTGYATNAAISGVNVGGKTGTAENGEDYQPYNLWFTGYGELDGRSVAVAVVVVPEENIVEQTSNVVAAPIGRAVIEAVLNQ